MKKSGKYIFDIEVFPNYFCVVLKQLGKNKVLVVDSDNFRRTKKQLFNIVSQNVLISYGGHDFDDIIINELLKHHNTDINKERLNGKIRIIRDNKKSKYKDIKYRFYSYDLLTEYDLRVGVKGFEFNRGYAIKEQDFANFNYNIRKEKYNEIVEEVIEYCLQDVIATEKMYNYILKRFNNWDEKEELLNLLTDGRYSQKMKLKEKIKYLKYNNDELVTLILNNKKLIKNVAKMETTSKTFPFIKEYNNKKASQVYKLPILEDYLYDWILNLKIFEKYKNSNFLISQIPKYFLLNGSFTRKKLNKYKRIIIKKINKFLKIKKIQIVYINENDLFLTNIKEKDLIEIKQFLEKEYSSIFSFEKIDKFIKNNKKNSVIYKIGKEFFSTENFYFDDLVSPKTHLWLFEVIKKYFFDDSEDNELENLNLKENENSKKPKIKLIIEKLYNENKEIFFMYMATNEPIYSCDENGLMTYDGRYNLPRFKKYRLYFSKTGQNKVINRKQEKYNEKFGFGNINNKFYKVKQIVTSVAEFENYEDFDIESYVEYATNYINEFL